MLQAASEDAKQGGRASAIHKQAASGSKIPLAPQARHAKQSALLHKVSSKQSALIKPAAPASNSALMASSRFPGFAVKPSQDTTVPGVELSTRAKDIRLEDHKAVPGLKAPVQSDEVTMHGQSTASVFPITVCLATVCALEFCNHHAQSVSCRCSPHHCLRWLQALRLADQ